MHGGGTAEFQKTLMEAAYERGVASRTLATIISS
jgi:hypothetical protein